MNNKSKEEALDFLMSQKGGVISTVSNNQPHSAYVFYDADEDFSVYFGTVIESNKHSNIQENNKVAFVVQTVNPPKTIQIRGEAFEVKDTEVLKNALANYVDIAKDQIKNSAPVTKIDAHGNLILYKIKPNWIKWSDFSGSGEGLVGTILLGDSR
ncbi:MAG: hypothetical protein AB198_01275 [Parcubacteria bacterium C7867-003]|nr:MAG: hypothetical protein AB198_01275 [Parcubacteria bacterium C7867-003]